MARYMVTTPAAGHNGKVGEVTFVDGAATVDGDTHPAELAYCRAAGYGVAAETSGDAPARKTRGRKATKAAKATEGEAGTATAETSGDAPADGSGDDEETTS